MKDKPTHYKTYDTDTWHLAPASLVRSITNSGVMDAKEVLIVRVPHSMLPWKIFALRWSNGDEWNAKEGMVKGELPR